MSTFNQIHPSTQNLAHLARNQPPVGAFEVDMTTLDVFLVDGLSHRATRPEVARIFTSTVVTFTPVGGGASLELVLHGDELVEE